MTDKERNVIYNRGSKDSNFHNKNFFIHYKDLLNKPYIKNKGLQAYSEYLSLIDKDIQKVGMDFSKNLIIVCNKNIFRDVFLVGFSKLSRLQSYYLCNTGKLMDIFYGNMKADNPMVAESDVMMSEQNINQDILLLEMNKVIEKTHSDRVITNTVMGRSNRTNARGDLLCNWIFYTGYLDEFKYSYPMLYNSYSDPAMSENFQIVDASNLFTFLQGVKRSDISFHGNVNKVSTRDDGVILKVNGSVDIDAGLSNTGNSELDEMY